MSGSWPHQARERSGGRHGLGMTAGPGSAAWPGWPPGRGAGRGGRL